MKKGKTVKSIEVVAAVIKVDDRILSTQRGYGDYEGWWEFPGGKVEAGESHPEALKREIREELDIEIEPGDVLAKVEYDYPKFHLTMTCYWCKVLSGQMVLKEHKNAKYLKIQDLDTVQWLPADIEVLEKIQEEYGM